MSTRSWIAPLFRLASRTARSRSQRGSVRRVRGTRRLGLELLEHRLAPATLTVNSPLDTASDNDPYLALREAIAIVNSRYLPTDLSPEILAQIDGTLHGGGADTVQFDPAAVTGPIVLGGTQLQLRLSGATAAVTIDGGNGVTVDGNNASRVLMVDGGARVTIAHLTVTHGRVVGNGAGILNAGTLTVTDSTLASNSADGGGGIYNNGTLTVSYSTITSSSAYDSGGGIYSAGGTVNVSNSTLTSNSAGYGGGGICSAGGTLTVSNCTFSSNFVSGDFITFGLPPGGGGIYSAGGTATVNNSTLTSNSTNNGVGGGIANGGTLTVSNSTLSANSASAGGGIANVVGGGGTATVSNSALTSNSTNIVDGNAGTVTVSNSTLTANSASTADQNGPGGGIYNSGTMTVNNSTLYANSADGGGGIFNASDQGGTLLLRNTIVAANSDSIYSVPDIYGDVISTSSYNLVGDGTGLTGISDGVNHNQIGTADPPIDPLLSPLGDYGGPTQTCALLVVDMLQVSPALNMGDPAFLGTPDQRGVVRSGGVNIGAFQASASAFRVTVPGMTTVGVPFDVTVEVVDIFGQRAVGYTGTITFSTTDRDPRVVLPPDYTFLITNGGMFTFSPGVTLFTTGHQSLTVTDTTDSDITGSLDFDLV